MPNLRARACTKCEEYIVIHPDNPINQKRVRIFDLYHRGHTLVTLDLNEIKGKYNGFDLTGINLNENKSKDKNKKIKESPLKDSKTIDISDSNTSKLVNSKNIEA